MVVDDTADGGGWRRQRMVVDDGGGRLSRPMKKGLVVKRYKIEGEEIGTK